RSSPTVALWANSPSGCASSAMTAGPCGCAIHSSERCCGPSRSSRPAGGAQPWPVSSPRRRTTSATVWPGPRPCATCAACPPPPPVHTQVVAHRTDGLSRPAASALPDGLHRRIVTFLAMAPKLSIESRWQRAIELATELNPYVAPAPPEGTFPEQFLSAIV